MAADPRRVKELFVALLDLPDAHARQAFLERECAADADLRQRLEALLKAHENPASVLDRPLAAVGPEGAGAMSSQAPVNEPVTTCYRGPDEDVGSVIAGRYKLLEQIGEGGMGTVWVAEQTQPVRRKVALKLIKAGMDSKTVLGGAAVQHLGDIGVIHQRQGAGRRHHRERPAFLRHGVRQGRPVHQVL